MTGTGPDWLGLLRAQTDRFADLVAGADPDARVTFCPGWSLRDLVVHLGGVHQWAAHAVVAGRPDLRPEPPDDEGAGLAAWYRDSAARLVDVLTTTPAHAPAWTLDVSDPTAGFWRRRQVHETTLHLWDASSRGAMPCGWSRRTSTATSSSVRASRSSYATGPRCSCACCGTGSTPSTGSGREPPRSCQPP
ncbi:maleylpyruvate isomerase family mycothiol-dependent enzyme [Nocardioides sp.]|uniref:maleylpyruvate isomerase family mycothiol-dependent enzyme n=1 Tax=Nocardioides sp. TaxID=35761 RepID=UPI0026313544|nr:maleylpyruvate isomerase family mycothiol-dependent enzyme [Nocardioides sp.]MCW2737281.1 hypothetical protein [Nocardioides sp.]